METDKRYFFEGLFVIGLVIAAALFFVWLVNAAHRDDVLYRIRFAESVSGLAPGDPVKFQGVDVGTVKQMAIDPGDPSRVQVDVALRKEAPVKTDTKATLKLKGFTGVVFIELSGGSAEAKSLLAATPAGSVPEIASEKSTLTTVLDQLPQTLEKLSAIEDKLPKAIDKISALGDQGKKVLSDMSGVTAEIKQNPSVLIWGPKNKERERSTRR
jgi:phospholipid/cholesterol/gamma-HCH transport system substrate-binding protein